jgi:hypothetical protein
VVAEALNCARFIVLRARRSSVALPGAPAEWREWCAAVADRLRPLLVGEPQGALLEMLLQSLVDDAAAQ